MKPSTARIGPQVTPVASRAEAWVETPGRRDGRGDDIVASRAEAWVETYYGKYT